MCVVQFNSYRYRTFILDTSYCSALPISLALLAVVKQLRLSALQKGSVKMNTAKRESCTQGHLYSLYCTIPQCRTCWAGLRWSECAKVRYSIAVNPPVVLTTNMLDHICALAALGLQYIDGS